ncbi:MAG: hypothetical protein DWI00_18270 [Planctomycetota bacterium]|nr:MAG: hypothetical protein DWI00_18270 [Planctomycetota bacterium]
MRRINEQLAFAQILPLLAAFSIVSGSVGLGEEPFSNELGAKSPKDEPQVILLESPNKVPIRPASGAILESNDPLVKLVYETREITRQRLLNTTDHTPWQMMHGLLGLRQDFLINHNGQTINGLEWMQTGPMFKNEPWFQKTSHGGRAHPFNHPYWFEGHINQSLAILAMCNLPLDTQFGTPQGPITMRDMLKNAQMTANAKEEVTWTLWALATYLPSDAEWINEKGERWSIERLVLLETGKQVGGPTSPCGGTHGLFALARARNVYMKTGKPLRGVWAQADQKIQKYIRTIQSQLNKDGSLSSNFFRGRDYKQDFDKRMASMGHLLEFLMVALPQERLKEPWVRKAIEATANDLKNNRKAYVSCSPLYHATDALTIYLERVLPQQQAVAQQPQNTKAISNSQPLPAGTATTTTPSAKTPGAAPAASTPATSGTPVVSTPPAIPGAAVNPGTPSVMPQTGTATTPAPMPAPGPTSPVPAPTPLTPAAPLATPPAATPMPMPENPLKQIPLPDPADELPAETPPAAAPALAPTPLTATEPSLQPLPAETVVAVVPADEVASEVRSTPSPTVVIAASVGSTPTVSAEEVPLVAGPAEATSVVMPPTPLIIAAPANDSNTPSVKVSTAVATPGTNAETKTAALPEPTPTPAPGDKKPAQKRSVEWKATPIERRKTIIVESPPSV